jgi:NAD(P)-dependent dehydrogenase (short-subunit alcohol dehydrogenase family)
MVSVETAGSATGKGKSDTESITSQRKELSMDLKIQGKLALVSGSTKGIGFATARMLAGEGARVIVNGRTESSVEKAVAEIHQTVAGARVEGVAADLGSAAGAEELFRRFPELDILVNNLGIYEPKPFEEIDDDDWRRFFEINVLSAVRLSRIYLPGMKARNWGRIVFISSESAIQIPVEMVHYGMSKTALLAVSRGIAEACAGTGVTSNAVLPGPTLSAGVEEFVNKLSAGRPFEEFEEEFFKEMRPTSLLKRFTGTDEIASLVTYLCSPLSSATTGAALRADGGVVKACF